MASHLREYGVGELTKRIREMGGFKDAPGDKKLLVAFCVSTVLFLYHFVMFSLDYPGVEFKVTRTVDEFLKVSQAEGFEAAREQFPQFQKLEINNCPRGFTCVAIDNEKIEKTVEVYNATGIFAD